MYLTNNISEHINKILNSHFNNKFPTFEKWKYALINTEKEINSKLNLVERSDYVTKILLYFIKKNKDKKISNDLLTLEDITKLSSLMKPESSIGNIIPLSGFIDDNFSKLVIKEEIKIESDIKNVDNKNAENSNFENDNSSEIECDSDSIDDKNDNNSYENLYNKLSKDDDLSFNIQQLLNNLKLDDE